ncbi:MAG: tripartite tricarboxylate transporter permease [Homoserinimonas sp.]
MDTWSLIAEGWSTAITPMNVFFCLIGVVVGTVIGLLPGLGSATGVALLLPLTLTMEPVTALIMLAGIYYGSQYGATISSVLIGTPGDSSSYVTMFDGYPMARRGRAGGALASAAIASFIGGSVSLILLMVAMPLLSSFALKFGPPETVALVVLAMLSVAGFAGKSVVKAIAMGVFGVIIATIGIDGQSAIARFTFGQVELFGGLGLIPVLIGLVAIAEVLRQTTQGGSEPLKATWRDMTITREELKRTMNPSWRGSLIGFFIGILPGAGATLASFISYEAERRVMKDGAKRMGTGMIEGVAGPESANNAAANGAFVPMLSLGVPGSATTAILLGAFLVFGLQPGPLLMTEQPVLVWGLILSFWIGNLILLVLNVPLAPLFASILRFRYVYIYPAVLLLCLAGAFSAQNRMWGIWIALAFGAIGYFFLRYQYPIAPLILGLVLGPLLEKGLDRSLAISHGDPMVFFERPISLVILIFSLALLVLPSLIRAVRRRVLGVRSQTPMAEKEPVEVGD